MSRSDLLKKTQAGDKKRLPYVTFSSEFAEGQLRRLSSEFNHTGLFMMDIDKLSEQETQKVYRSACGWDKTVFAFISPSGNGVKILVRTDMSESDIMNHGHALVNSVLIEEVAKKMGTEVDPLKDSTRACFIVATDNVHYNSSAGTIHVDSDMFRREAHDIEGVEGREEPLETPIYSQSMVMRMWKGTARRLGSLPKQSRYSWLVSFVTECHKKGIAKSALLKFMSSYVQKLPEMQTLTAHDLTDYTTVLVNKVYKAYPDEFGVHYEWFLDNSARYSFPMEGIDLVNSRLGDVAAYAVEQFPEFFFHAGNLYKFTGRIFEVIDEDTDVEFLDMVQAMTVRDSRANTTELVRQFKARSQKSPANGNGALKKALFKNGILNVETWKLETVKPDDLVNYRFTFQFDYDYNPNVNDSNWNKVVKKVMTPNEKLDKVDDSESKEQLLYDFLGYALFGNGDAEQVLLFSGKGANGKSSLINTIQSAFPAAITEAIAPSQFGDRFTGANLEGKLLNIVSDIAYSDLGNEAEFKKIVSNETMTMEEKYKKPRKGVLHCSHIFAANGDLEFKNYDAALDRRFLTIMLEQVFYKEDRDYSLKTKLKSDSVKQTIINKAIQGWIRYESRGLQFVIPESTEEAQKERVSTFDHSHAFFQQCLVFEEGAKTSQNKIVEAYQEWCMEKQIMRGDRIASNRFGAKIREYVQYHADKRAKIIKPQNRLHVKNMSLDMEKYMSGEMSEELAEVERMLRR